MIFSDMITEVKAYSGEQSDTRIKAAINTIYRHLRNALKWPQTLITCATPIVLTSAQQFTLATNFRFINKVWVYDESGEPIYIRPLTSILNNKNDGTVLRYRIKRGSAGSAAVRPAWIIELEPIANSAFISMYTSLYYEYYFSPSDLSGNTDVTIFDADDDGVIVLGASALLTAKQSDTKTTPMIQSMFLDAKADMIQRAIEVFGNGVIIKPGDEITEDFGGQINDYGRIM